LLFFGAYYLFFIDKIERFFSNKNYRIFFHILNAYTGYYLTNLILSYLFNYDLPSIDYKYLLYIVTDFLITVVIV
jgi:hypothetical protein